MTRELGTWRWSVLAAVLLVVVVVSSGVLPERTAMMIGDSAQLIGAVAAVVLCLWTSRRLQGVERRWRQLIALGMGGWLVGMGFWAWHRWFMDIPMPSPSWGDIGFFALPVFALPALLVLAVEPPRHASSGQRYASLVAVLDSWVVVGSLFVITWSTVLGAVVTAGAPTSLELLIAIGYPATDLVLVTLVVLLLVTGRVPQRYQTQLGFLGAGLVALSASDAAFAYLVSSGAEKMPLYGDAGFIAGPVLIALAAVATAEGAPPRWSERARTRRERAHLLLPFVLLAVTAAVIVVQLAVGSRVGTVEVAMVCIVVGLVLVRLGVTIVDHTAVLKELTEAKEYLAYRAQHDPLTGLANRSLFNERLQDAMDRRRDDGSSFALLIIDLDDFKAINDSLGHAAGDRLLHTVGERLRGCVRGSDTVARLGGDEFAVVLEGTAEAPHAVAERILDVVRRPYRIEGHMLSLSASVGVVEADRDDGDITADSVLRRADGAMYAGKRRGKAMVVLYEPGTEVGSRVAAQRGSTP